MYSRQRVSGVPSAASVIETSIVTTSPNRSTSNAKATVASVIMMTGRQAQRVRPGPSVSTALSQSSAPVPIRHQARMRGRTPVPGRWAVPIVIVGADPKRGEPDGDEQ